MTSSITPANNIFANYPPIIPMVFLAVTLVAMAQFGSTERLATALAWLIFVAVLFANGGQALDNITGKMGSGTPVTTTGTTGTTSVTGTTNKGTA